MHDFHFLSSASVLAPHYSASVSSFPSSSCFCLTVASTVLVFRFRFLRFPRSLLPGFPCIPSRFRYSAFCLFPFVLPCFAPTAVPQVLAFGFRFRPFPFFFRFLSSASFPVLTTQPSVLLFPFFLLLPHSGFFSAPLSLSFLRFPPFSPA